jgi:DNA-directed RNA polymerase III subunit RPC2
MSFAGILINFSSTHERKSRTSLISKAGCLYIKVSISTSASSILSTLLGSPQHNNLVEDVGVVVFLKAMGIASDQELIQLVGHEPEVVSVPTRG